MRVRGQILSAENDVPDDVKLMFKWSFCGDSEHDDFSLSDTDRETASLLP